MSQLSCRAGAEKGLNSQGLQRPSNSGRMKTLQVLTFVLEIVFIISVKSHNPLAGIDAPRHYAGYSVFRMVPTDKDELAILKNLAEKEDYGLDFWKGPTHVNEPVDVMVPPSQITALEQFLINHRIPRAIMMYDVERYIIKERMDMLSPPFLTGRDTNTFFHSYRRMGETHQFLDDLASKNPNIASTFSIGKSSDGNDLKVIKIGSKTEKTSKPAIWIDGGIHAREWISPATVTYIASRLVEDYDESDDVKSLVNHFDWYIMPMLNPDGYEYSHTNNRMWRKNRRGVLFCRGVDLNRNFAFHWREGGSSSNPCSDTYAGSEAFSEPESKAVSEFILKRKDNFIAFLAVHSYSQLWLTPWGYTRNLPEDYDQMIAVAQEATRALSEVHGTEYKIGSSTNVLYVATGGADDWAKGMAGIKYSYTIELRDTGRYGFMLPSEQIIPTGEETWAGVQAMGKAIMKEE